MNLSDAQKATLKADILANPALTQEVSDRRDDLIRDYYNALASPTFTVWRTSVSRAEIYHQTSAESTTWSWTIFKGQTQGEQGSWKEMFMGDRADMSLPNLRAGVENIFGVSNAQTTHIKAIGKRACNRVERLFVTGTGSLAAPGTLVVEGSLTQPEVSALLNAA